MAPYTFQINHRADKERFSFLNRLSADADSADRQGLKTTYISVIHQDRNYCVEGFQIFDETAHDLGHNLLIVPLVASVFSIGCDVAKICLNGIRRNVKVVYFFQNLTGGIMSTQHECNGFRIIQIRVRSHLCKERKVQYGRFVYRIEWRQIATGR